MGKRRGNNEGAVYKRSADGLWIASLTVPDPVTGGKRRRYFSAKTRAEVLQKMKKIQRQLEDGLPLPDASVTVEQLFERWKQDVLRHQVAPNTVDNYMRIAIHQIIPTLGKKRLSQVTTNDVDRLLAKKRDEGYAISTVQRIRSVLAQAISQAMRWGWVNQNVATLARAPRAARREGRSLTPEQARHLLEILKGHRHEALYTLMLSTGLRRGEALGLKWIDLDEELGLLRVRRQLKREEGVLVATDTKTPKSRRNVNLPAQMLEVLKAHRTRQQNESESLGETWIVSGFIFTSSVGTPYDPRNMHREFRQICRSAELGDWHPHELRHSAASLMLAQGVKLQVVSEVLGHASIRMTADVYGHILDPDRQMAADAMAGLLWGSNESAGTDSR
jgi:integrase